MCSVLMLVLVQRLFKRLPQELLAAQLGVAVRAVRTSGRAQQARFCQPNRTSRLLTPRGHDNVAASLAYLLSASVFLGLSQN